MNRVFPAYLRPIKDTKPILTVYDCDSRKLANLSLNLPYDYFEDHNIPVDSVDSYFAKHMLYQFQRYSQAVAVILLYGIQVAIVTPTSLIVRRITTDEVEAQYSWKLDVSDYTRSDTILVGFEKVRPITCELFIPPGRVLFSKTTSEVYYNGAWRHFDKFEPKECTKKVFYYETLRDDAHDVFIYDGYEMKAIE